MKTLTASNGKGKRETLFTKYSKFIFDLFVILFVYFLIYTTASKRKNTRFYYSFVISAIFCLLIPPYNCAIYFFFVCACSYT